MPGYYRSSPDHRPAQPPPKRRPSAPRPRSHRFGFPSLPILNPRLLLGSRRHPTTPTAASRPTPRQRPGQRARRWLAARAWNLSHAGAGLMLALAVAGLIAVFTSLDFYVYRAEIAETRYLAPAALYQQAGVDGFSVFFLRPAAISQRLSQLPTIRSATVRLSLPNRVQISVVEREPVLLYQVQGETHWADVEGVLMPAADARSDLVKLIDDSNSAQLDARHIDPALLLAIQRITRDLPQINAFRYQEPFGMYFFSPEGWRVLLGQAENMDAKLLAWAALRQDLLRQRAVVQEVDLRFQHPYWR